MKHYRPFILTFCFLACLSFSVTAQALLPGQIIDRVICKSDSAHSYSLYLPSNYTPEKKWPVIFIYHASGLGKESVQTFKKAAETYGYILIGSYNFRNGSMLDAVTAAKVLFEEIPNQYSVDENRFFTSGLSGGARMASSMAINMPNVRGVIASAAGFNGAIQPAEGHDYMYVSVMGDKDFNYAELQQTHNRLNELKILNRMISFDGRHRWPPEDKLVEALAWIEVYSMKKELKPISSDFIKIFEQSRMEEGEHLLQSRQLVPAYRLYKDSKNMLQDITSTQALDDTFGQIAALKEFKKLTKAQARRLDSELADQQLLLQELKPKPNVPKEDMLDWWKNTMAQWVKNTKTQKLAEDRHRAQRLLSFTAIYGLPYGGNSLIQGNFEKALAYYQIVHWSHPENAKLTYFMAKLLAINDQRQSALSYYKKAIKQGHESTLTDKEAILAKLKDTSEFQILGPTLWRDLI